MAILKVNGGCYIELKISLTFIHYKNGIFLLNLYLTLIGLFEFEMTIIGFFKVNMGRRISSIVNLNYSLLCTLIVARLCV